MPDHKLHATLDYMLFGRAFPDIHKFMDSAQPYLQSNHRILYHDMQTVQDLTEMHGELAGKAAYMHIILDWVSDKVGQEKAVPVLLKLIEMGEVLID